MGLRLPAQGEARRRGGWALNEDDPHASWGIFEQFFRDIGDEVEISCAIERVVQRLEAEARGAEWPSVQC